MNVNFRIYLLSIFFFCCLSNLKSDCLHSSSLSEVDLNLHECVILFDISFSVCEFLDDIISFFIPIHKKLYFD